MTGARLTEREKFNLDCYTKILVYQDGTTRRTTAPRSGIVSYEGHCEWILDRSAQPMAITYDTTAVGENRWWAKYITSQSELYPKLFGDFVVHLYYRPLLVTDAVLLSMITERLRRKYICKNRIKF